MKCLAISSSPAANKGNRLHHTSGLLHIVFVFKEANKLLLLFLHPTQIIIPVRYQASYKRGLVAH